MEYCVRKRSVEGIEQGSSSIRFKDRKEEGIVGNVQAKEGYK